MAKQYITIAGIGPFAYDDTEHDAIETDGGVDAGSVNLVRALQKAELDVQDISNDLDCENLIVTLDFN